MSEKPLKRAQAGQSIFDLALDRWSPYVYDPRPVEDDKLRICLEAARWAASSYNEQPWSFLLARRQDGPAFQKMLQCLDEGNQAWAKNAGVLMISVVCPTFTLNGKPNRVAEYDMGAAGAMMSLQAVALGLQVHQMAGINLAKARQTYGIPETHAPMVGIAIGYPGDPARADDDKFRQRDQTPRERKKLSEFVFEDQWSQPARVARGHG